jgi:phosphopantothenoylcysteine decarboxylase/phosphopantothenate--cysteine ligase
MNGREILIGVTGGIAAYKTAALVSKLAQAGAGVSVVMTRAATKFVGATTFEALSGRPVYSRVFGEPEKSLGAHIELVERAELLCVAPATADFLAKSAHGIADDLLSTLYLSFSGVVLMAPAMNNVMWEKPSVQRNVHQLEQDRVSFVPPTEGWLSCREVGAGRMAEPEAILIAIEQALPRHQ